MRINIAVKELSSFFDNYFGGRKYFVCVYGSYLTGKKTKLSDVDLLVATENYTSRDFLNIEKYVLDFHKKWKLKIDNEVPFSNKLLFTYNELKCAMKLAGLTYKSGKITVPAVKKNKQFLFSRKIKYRLAFNAFTTPHLIIGNDKQAYSELKNVAEKNLTLFCLNNFQNEASTDKLVDVLLTGPRGETGEMYLGYKQYPKVICYLNDILFRQLIILKTNKIISFNKNIIKFSNIQNMERLLSDLEK